ncbi:MAG: SDR family oxidoreductase [Candidatus Margulisbacteria bacterium]|nr:SDR family oxidoreductase [Candidatus Margulisiibacteriota bacterium]
MIKFQKEDNYLVTGASSGIGRAIASKIIELGGSVIAVARREEKLNELGAVSEVIDLSAKVDDLSSWMLDLAKKHGKIKGLALSAGVQETVPLRATNLSKARQLFELNYFANLALAKGFCDKRVNAGRGSSMVFISSNAAISGMPGLVNYSASKGALDAAVRAMAAELARDGIRVNSVLPGFVRTEMTEKWGSMNGPTYFEEMDKKYPLGIGRPEQLSGVACFLLSDSAGWITGQNIVVDGGGSL